MNNLDASVVFCNWTDNDFTHNWGGQPFTFAAKSVTRITLGGSKEANMGLARHFTKHLVDREMNERGIPTDHHTRAEYEFNCSVEQDFREIPVVEVINDENTGLVKSSKVKGKVKPAIAKDAKEEKAVEEPKKEAKKGKAEPKVEKADADYE